MQVLTVMAMERPVSFAAEDIRDEKVRRTRIERYLVIAHGV
jgi:glucose-6-phosphate 1-dehydrogenase